MAKSRSKASKYKSPSTGDFCTAAQYITEILITRQAEKKHKKLEKQFWNKPPWKKKFLILIIQVNRLIKKYHPDVIANALGKNKWIYSLKFPKLTSILDKEQMLYDKFLEDSKKAQKDPKEMPAVDSNISRPKFGKTSLRNKLDE